MFGGGTNTNNNNNNEGRVAGHHCMHLEDSPPNLVLLLPQVVMSSSWVYEGRAGEHRPLPSSSSYYYPEHRWEGLVSNQVFGREAFFHHHLL